MNVTWECLCRAPHGIKSWTIHKCYRCGEERPDTAKLHSIGVEVRRAQEALDDLDRLSPKYGRFTAMSMVLARYGGAR